MNKLSVYDMVHQVIEDSRAQLTKQAQEEAPKSEEKKPEGPGADETEEHEKAEGEKTSMVRELQKLASACDYLADNLHLVVDTRTPTEKLAEYAAIQELLVKASQGEIPINPPLDSGDGKGGPSSAMQAEPAMTPGESMDAGESGEATPANQPPRAVEPNEKPQPLDAANALETNEAASNQTTQPENLLQQPGGAKVASIRKILSKKAQAEGGTSVNMGGAPFREYPKEKIPTPEEEKAKAEASKLEASKVAAQHAEKIAKAGHAPAKFAEALLRKIAEDALFPANIQAGTTPQLQQVPGVPSQLSQGSEAGELTPRETAPNVGEGSGRELIGSNEAAIKATKGSAKAQNRGALAELLNEPALSSAHDRVLHESLDATAGAGVKLAAQRQLLKKLAKASPSMKRKIAALVKKAQGGQLTPEEEAAMMYGGPAQGPEGQGPMDQGQGVTPEDMMALQQLLGQQQAPQAGQEDMTSYGQMGGGGTGQPPMMPSTPPMGM